MNNDLISRDAVIKSIQNKFNEFDFDSEYNEGLRDGYLNAIYAIEDAPAVSFMISPDYVTELQNHNKELIKQLEETGRPQGEWVDHSCYRTMIICSNCDSGDNRWHKDFKFCPNCGADMRGAV